ncbi:MAG: T9SS type A sorting domain-containing protein [Bacteroidia bacterium]
MRKLFMALLLLMFERGQAQSFNSAYHRYDDGAFNLTSINTTNYFSGTSYSNWFTDTAFVYSVNNNGQTLWKKPIIKYEYNHIERMRTSLDKQLLVIGYGRGCDYLDNTQKTFIMKLDTLGNTIFDNTFINVYSSNQLDYLKDVNQTGDSSYYCITDSVLFHFNKNGLLIKKKNTGLTGLQTLINYGQDQLLLSGKSFGVDKHIVIDTNGVIINSKPSYGIVTKYKKLSSGNIITLHNGVLKKISPGLVALDSSVISQGSTNIVDFDIDQDTIFSIGSLNSSYNYIKFDSSFISKYQFATNAKRIVPKAITTTVSNITILSNSTNTVSNSNQFIGLTSFDKTGTFTYTNDIGVISVTMDSSDVTTSNYPPGYTQYSAGYRLKVIIKNYGNFPIQHFYLNHFIRQEICGNTYYHPWMTLPLAPGATVSITTPMFTNIMGVLPGPPSSQTFSVNDACIYTTLPDGRNDVDFTNDATCITVLIPYVTSIAQHTILNPDVIVSPNPFHDKILISGEVEIRKVEVFNIMGQLIKTISVNGKNTELLLEESPSGIYLIKLYSEKGVFTKKAVKE